MDTQTIVIVAVAINLVILIGAIVVPRLTGRRRGPAIATAANESSANGSPANQSAGARATAAAGSAAVSNGSIATTSTTARGGTTVSGAALDAGAPWFQVGAEAGGPADGAGSFDPSDAARAAAGTSLRAEQIDPTTGFDLGPAWARWLTEEEARILRFHRPATVVLVELSGLDRLADRLGSEVAGRLIPPIATTLRREARATDHLVRLGPTRFAALLVETSEVQAINFVERVRTACDVWLEAGAVALRLSIGWAEIGPERAANVAVLDAERRLFAERERARRQLAHLDAEEPDPPIEVPALQNSGA